VRSAFHIAFGKAVKVSSCSPASSKLFATAGHSFRHFATKAWYASRAASPLFAYTIRS